MDNANANATAYRTHQVGDVRNLRRIERVIVDRVDLFGAASSETIIRAAQQAGYSEYQAKFALRALVASGKFILAA